MSHLHTHKHRLQQYFIVWQGNIALAGKLKGLLKARKKVKNSNKTHTDKQTHTHLYIYLFSMAFKAEKI